MSTPSPRIDYLSRLPNELLHQIFEETYADWTEGRSWRARPKPLTSPLSRRLVDFQRQALYRNTTVKRWMGTGSLATLIDTVITHPHIGSFIVSLCLEIPSSRDSLTPPNFSEADFPSDTLDMFFASLVNLRSVLFSGSNPIRSPSTYTVYIDCRPAFLSLVCATSDSRLVSITSTRRGTNGRFFPTPRSRNSPQTQVSQLSVHPHKIEPGIGPLRGYAYFEMVAFNFLPLATVALPSSAAPPLLPASVAIQDKKRTVSPLLSDLKDVTFSCYSPDGAAPLLNLLPQLPFENYTFRILDAVSPTSLLVLLIKSDPLRKLEVSYVGPILKDGEVGKVGTRVSTVDFDRVFRGIHPETEDVAEDAMPDDWIYPQLSCKVPIEDLLMLREKAIEAGFEFDGGKLYEAIEVQQAANDDVKLLNELWQKWKKRSRNSGKGRKSRQRQRL